MSKVDTTAEGLRDPALQPWPAAASLAEPGRLQSVSVSNNPPAAEKVLGHRQARVPLGAERPQGHDLSLWLSINVMGGVEATPYFHLHLRVNRCFIRSFPPNKSSGEGARRGELRPEHGDAAPGDAAPGDAEGPAWSARESTDSGGCFLLPLAGDETYALILFLNHINLSQWI